MRVNPDYYTPIERKFVKAANPKTQTNDFWNRPGCAWLTIGLIEGFVPDGAQQCKRPRDNFYAIWNGHPDDFLLISDRVFEALNGLDQLLPWKLQKVGFDPTIDAHFYRRVGAHTPPVPKTVVPA